MGHCHYTPYYCEENIWHLCDHPELSDREKLVVWIGSLQGVCPLWHQRAASQPGQPVWWDYHVVLVVKDNGFQVWDLDTTLALPVPATEYFEQTFAAATATDSQAAPLFRIMDAEYYRRQFSSDRSHMRGESGLWLAPPPDWPAIAPHAVTFFDMKDFTNTTHGTVITLDAVRSRISSPDGEESR